MELCTAAKRSLSETMTRDRVRVEFDIRRSYGSQLWFTVYDLDDDDLQFRRDARGGAVLVRTLFQKFPSKRTVCNDNGLSTTGCMLG